VEAYVQAILRYRSSTVATHKATTCLRCMGIICDDVLERERYGAAGGRPQVVWPNGMLASAAVGIAVQLLTPWCEPTGAAAARRQPAHTHTRCLDAAASRRTVPPLRE
jgi:hypothetical protein